MVKTKYRSTGKGCEEKLPQDKVKKRGSDLQKRQTNSFQKVSEKNTRKRMEARKSTLPKR